MKKKKIVLSLIGAALVAALTLGSGVYAQRVMNTSELVHFFIPFPAGMVSHPMTVQNPAGGRIFTKPLTINVDERGILKQLFNPGIEGIGTHWLTNVDTKPHRVGLKLCGTNIPVRWKVGSGIPWDEQSGTFSQALQPGASIPDFGIDWLFYFPPEIRAQKTWYKGTLMVFDADTGESLTTIPITFQQKNMKAEAAAAAAGSIGTSSCCE